jgi:hypothetical protein
MSTMILRFKVKDYDAWRQFFDAGQSRREAFGLSNGHVFRSVEDENEVVLLFDVTDLTKAKQFPTLPEREAIWEKSGVVGTPSHYLIE